MLPDVQQGMNELRSEQLAQLVSLGGWLRGAQALSALVLQDYSDQNAELLRQSSLLDYFDRRLGEMDSDIAADPVVVRMREGIHKVRPLIAPEESRISRKTVKQIAGISGSLIKSITR